MPTCMECEIELELDYTQDTDLEGDIVLRYQTGYCPNCGKHYTWTDYYEFTNFGELKVAE